MSQWVLNHDGPNSTKACLVSWALDIFFYISSSGILRAIGYAWVFDFGDRLLRLIFFFLCHTCPSHGSIRSTSGQLLLLSSFLPTASNKLDTIQQGQFGLFLIFRIQKLESSQLPNGADSSQCRFYNSDFWILRIPKAGAGQLPAATDW